MGLGPKRGRIILNKGKTLSEKGKNYWGESFFWEDLTGLGIKGEELNIYWEELWGLWEEYLGLEFSVWLPSCLPDSPVVFLVKKRNRCTYAL
jgi:hypothetical protein